MPELGPRHVIDREGYVWAIVRDGGMATRADYVGIISIGIECLRLTAGPLVAFDAAKYWRSEVPRTFDGD